MIICMPTLNNQGIKSDLSTHFGSAPFFLFIHTETLEVEALPNGDANHAHGMCQPLAMIGNRPYDAIVVSGIGGGALSKLNAAGKKVYKTEFATVEETVNAYKLNQLKEFSPQATCSHEHGTGHGHSHK